MIAKPEKAEYEAKQLETDSEIDAKTTEEITEFLETFFKLYPTASEKELEYYVQGKALRIINTNLKFVEIKNYIYQKNNKDIQANIIVKYIDDRTKTTASFQYDLFLKKDENWKIINSNKETS